jgi:hypothetical protein
MCSLSAADTREFLASLLELRVKCRKDVIYQKMYMKRMQKRVKRRTNDEKEGRKWKARRVISLVLGFGLSVVSIGRFEEFTLACLVEGRAAKVG